MMRGQACSSGGGLEVCLRSLTNVLLKKPPVLLERCKKGYFYTFFFLFNSVYLSAQ